MDGDEGLGRILSKCKYKRLGFRIGVTWKHFHISAQPSNKVKDKIHKIEH